MSTTKELVDRLYRTYNRKKYVSPDPLQFLYNYPAVCDREIAALVASSLAYGRVAQILRSVERVLSKMGTSPHSFLLASNNRQLSRTFAGFKHRFTTDVELVSMLSGMRAVISNHGSLNSCFVAGLKTEDRNIVPALQQFTDELGCAGNYLIPSPSRGSACKRLNLFLRWMVRKDAVDPGGWAGVARNKLIVPLDVHMARIGQLLALTNRKSTDMKMAIEITESLAAFSPKDPVKYDFALTRFGIRDDLDVADLTAG